MKKRAWTGVGAPTFWSAQLVRLHAEDSIFWLRIDYTQFFSDELEKNAREGILGVHGAQSNDWVLICSM